MRLKGYCTDTIWQGVVPFSRNGMFGTILNRPQGYLSDCCCMGGSTSSPCLGSIKRSRDLSLRGTPAHVGEPRRQRACKRYKYSLFSFVFTVWCLLQCASFSARRKGSVLDRSAPYPIGHWLGDVTAAVAVTRSV